MLTVLVVFGGWLLAGIGMATALGPTLRRAARVAGTPLPLAWEATALERLRQQRRWRRGTWAVSGAVATVLFAGSGGLAAAGALPAPAQTVAHTVLSNVGVIVPQTPTRSWLKPPGAASVTVVEVAESVDGRTSDAAPHPDGVPQDRSAARVSGARPDPTHTIDSSPSTPSTRPSASGTEPARTSPSAAAPSPPAPPAAAVEEMAAGGHSVGAPRVEPQRVLPPEPKGSAGAVPPAPRPEVSSTTGVVVPPAAPGVIARIGEPSLAAPPVPGPFVEGPVPPPEGPAESVAEPVIPVRPYVKGPVAVTARKVEAGAEKKKDKSLPAHARRGQGPASVDSGSEPE